ncbi:MAG TPA: lysylphosphatidylglycerol synthase domain-containing protein, partial [Thermoanaerobaculia bacterium]|nr:lysylphosphatidylglycerol synthase domain-containing protein [Thermoanaerobaculia bacterium]
MDAPLRAVPGSGGARSASGGGLTLPETAAAPGGHAPPGTPAATPAAPATTPATDSPRPEVALYHLGRRLLPVFALGLLVLAGLLGLADPRHFLAQLRRFDFALLAPILALSPLNYSLRFVRWEIYLRALGARLPLGRSCGVFLTGFLLSVTPGKAGELGKAWLVRELGGGPAL